MKIKQFLKLSLILIVIAGLGNSVAYAASLCVHPASAGRCFTSIQAAVDAANSGDQILIRAGTYVEQVTISGKDLTLQGRPGAISREYRPPKGRRRLSEGDVCRTKSGSARTG